MASIGSRVNRDGSVTWRVQFRVDTRMRQASFLDPEGAEQFGALVDKIGGQAALRVLDARKVNDHAKPTLREWVTTYLDIDSGLLTGVEDGTRAEYRRCADRSFLNILGDYPVDAIGKADIGRWLAWQERQASRTGSPVSAKTVRNYHGILSSVLKAAVEQKLRDDNPAYRTRLTGGTKREGVFLSRDEFATILHFIPARYEALFLFLAGTGCRWGEATAVTWGNINTTVTPATVRIEKAWKKGRTGAPVLKQPKSKKARRTISITPDVLAALGEPGPADQLVFRGPISGGHLWYGRVRDAAWEKALTSARDVEACDREGLPVLRQTPTIHDLRHTHASWLIAAGVPLPYIQARLGHEKITTTVDTYGHLVPDAHRQMADVISTTLAGVRPLRQIA